MLYLTTTIEEWITGRHYIKTDLNKDVELMKKLKNGKQNMKIKLLKSIKMNYTMRYHICTKLRDLTCKLR